MPSRSTEQMDDFHQIKTLILDTKTTDSQEANNGLAKRQKRAQNSMRFRASKKQKALYMEQQLNNLDKRVTKFKSKIHKLELENAWLRKQLISNQSPRDISTTFLLFTSTDNGTGTYKEKTFQESDGDRTPISSRRLKRAHKKVTKPTKYSRIHLSSLLNS
jgi:hypothetical protein